MKTTLEELQAFATVAASGSITGAAGQLGQTVSGISRALARLEKKLDTTLLHRTTRRIALTEEGQDFLVRTRAILAAMDEAEESLVLRRQVPAGRLRVNAATPFMLHAIAPLVPSFQQRYPQVLLQLETDEQNIDLLQRHTDIAIRIGALRDSTLHARALCSSRLRVLASPAYLAARGTPRTVQDLSRHLRIGFTQPEALNRWPLRGAHGDTWPSTPTLTASSGETLRQLALAGAGIVCLADFMTSVDRSQGALVEVLARHTADARQTVNAVYYRNTQLAARITCFLDFLAEHMAPD